MCYEGMIIITDYVIKGDHLDKGHKIYGVKMKVMGSKSSKVHLDWRWSIVEFGRLRILVEQKV